MTEQEEIHEYNLRCAEFMKKMKYKKAHGYIAPFENLKYLYKVDTNIYDTLQGTKCEKGFIIKSKLKDDESSPMRDLKKRITNKLNEIL